jgi:pyruvate,water dikinase
MFVSDKGFPKPLEVEIPEELKGWEEMYPPHYIFSKEREEWESRQFWYLDKIHAPDPMYPWDLIFHEAWQIALAQYNTRVFCIPPAQGVAQRMLGCYFYICAVEPPSEETIKEKAELFQKRAFYAFEKYDELWEKWQKKFKELGERVKEIEVPDLPRYEPDDRVFPAPRGFYSSYDLMEAYDSLIDAIYKAWQYHFEYLNLSYLAYLTFADTVRKLFPGISEATIGKMVAGAYVVMFRPEEELARLARLAVSLGGKVLEILKSDEKPEKKLEELGKFPEGREWIHAFEEAKDPWFYVSTGSGWFHYEGSWIDTLEVPFEYLRSYIQRIESGERVERDLEMIEAERDKLVKEYRELIKSEDDRKAFDDAYGICRKIYSYAENHLFWVEHWFHTIVFEKMREFGRIFTRYGMIDDVEDIFLFNRFEIPMMIEDLVTAWALGENVPPRAEYWKAKAEKRNRILEAAKNWSPPPALGTVPEEIAEPFTVMLWGVTSEKVAEWIKGVAVRPEEVSEVKGFAASAGVTEGKARVIRFLDEITTIQEGEILVCPTTNPSWAPVFTKIKAAVTDIGGLTSHAAIVCREYGLPAVTGTGVATQVIKTGDLRRGSLPYLRERINNSNFLILTIFNDIFTLAGLHAP